MSSVAAITLTEVDHTSQVLLDYLRTRTSNPRLLFSEPPERMTGGYDAAIFSFRLEGGAPEHAQPLVLRLAGPGRAAQLIREAAVQTALAAMGYPAAAVLFVESDDRVLGGPFLVMERLRGRPLAAEFESLRRTRIGLASLLGTITRVFSQIGSTWTEAQTRLHELDANEFLSRLEDAGLRREDFLFDHVFAEFRRLAEQAAIEGLAPGLAWVDDHRPREAAPSVICHGDLQPLNVLGENGVLTGVLDWGSAVIAHPALDYGAAVAILATVPIAAPALVRPIMRGMMSRLARNHARSYFRRCPGGEAALRYFAAHNCLSQLVWVGLSYRSTKRLEGAGAYGSAVGVRNLTQKFRALTGVRLHVAFP